MINPKYKNGDMVVFKLVKDSTITYNGIVTSSWTSNLQINKPKKVYSISCMDFGMNSYSISEECIVKKIA